MGIGRLIVFLGVLLLLWLAYRWFIRTAPEKVAKSLPRIAIGAIIMVLIVLAATGRMHPLFAAIGAAAGALFTVAQRLMRMPWIIAVAQRLFYHYRAKQNSAGPSPDQRSQVETQFIRMFLYHDSGEMGGEIIAGQMAGCSLSQLDLQQLITLWQHYNAIDTESAALLEAYLNRIHGDTWHDQCETEAKSNNAPPPTGQMSPEEASKILAVEKDADKETVIAAHRRLAQKLHPDRGGSTYLAAKINRAKEVLLGKP